MNETEFQLLVDAALNTLSGALEEMDQKGTLDVEFQDGVMTITMPAGKQFIVSKHTASRQIWLSSPLSGGLHFGYHNHEWRLPDGRTLSGVLSRELKTLAEIEVVF